MQVASMVRISGRDEGFEAQLRHHQHQQQLLSHRRTRAHEPQPPLGTALVSSPYSNHNPQPFGYTYQPQRVPAPQSPPSPPSEEVGKPSLPSISSLLGIADGKYYAYHREG